MTATQKQNLPQIQQVVGEEDQSERRDNAERPRGDRNQEADREDRRSRS